MTPQQANDTHMIGFKISTFLTDDLFRIFSQKKTSKSRNLESSIFQIKMKIGEFVPNIWKKLVTFLFKSLSVKSPSINIWIKIKILILGQSQGFTIFTFVNQKLGGLKCNYLIIWRFIGIKRSKVAIKWTFFYTIVCTSTSFSQSVKSDDRSDFFVKLNDPFEIP